MLHATRTQLISNSRLFRGATLLAAAAAVVTAGTLIGAGTAPGAGSASNCGLQHTFRSGPGCIKWEYAEFTIQGDRAIVVGQFAAQELLPPLRLDDRDIVFENNAGQFVERFNLRMYYINLMGSEGWEFTDGWPVEENKTVMVRRQKK